MGLKKRINSRRQVKQAQELIRHARHLRNMREDVMADSELRHLETAETAVATALRTKADTGALAQACEGLDTVVGALQPAKWRSTLRENIEVLVVAISVAMAFRAYLLQPFKIPTGSMQPTLYGIHAEACEAPGIMDRYPQKLLKFVLTGAWYSARYAQVEGYCTGYEDSATDPSVRYLFIGNVRHRVPKDADIRGEVQVRPGMHVRKGDLLWSGYVTRGDHLFVNKVVWNFRKPRRGEIMVFGTTGIPTLPDGTHYIKRMVGLPNESISIRPPFACANGVPISKPDEIARIAARRPGYEAGYRLIHPRESGYLHQPGDVFALGDNEYFALGDNTANSRDSRYWGKVPGANLVGPAAVVYWPFSRRWGIAH
jgi:signal peptidase I